jgi:hypothetical protein
MLASYLSLHSHFDVIRKVSKSRDQRQKLNMGFSKGLHQTQSFFQPQNTQLQSMVFIGFLVVKL